jgi:exonuclease SbcD
MSAFGTVVVGQWNGAVDSPDWEKIVIPLRRRDGSVGAWCIAMPFLRPADLPPAPNAENAYAEGISHVYRAAYQRAKQKQSTDQAILAIGHCHMNGGLSSEESERKIVIGGVESLSVSLFPEDIAYVALGHLHLAQKLGGTESRRYSGSPLPMSFSEIAYKHQVIVFDLVGAEAQNIRSLPIPRPVELLRIPAKPAPLASVLEQLQKLELPERPETEWPYLQVRVLLNQPEPTLRAQLEAALQGRPLRLVKIETSYVATAAEEAMPLMSLDEVSAMAPENYFKIIYERQFQQETPPELMTAFQEILAQTKGLGGDL